MATTRTDKLDTVWPLEDHTAAKHDILRGYLGAWFPIMAQRQPGSRIVYIDGFAGPGVYDNGQPGSPLLALERLVGHPRFPLWTNEFVFMFIEADEERYASLVEELTRFWTKRGGQPKNVKVNVVNETFADVAEQILAALGTSRLAPTFAFVDPFGFKGVALDTVARLVSFRHCEVFFNFMFNSVNRFLTAPQVGDQMEALFGTDRCFEVDGLDADEREEFLLGLYGEQLRVAANMDHVHRFTMTGPKNKQVCTLFYGTRSLDGVRKMKEAMWKVDPGGGCHFSDVTAGYDTLFTPEPDLAPLRAGIIEKFNDQTVSIEDIDRYVVGDTPYLSTHFKKQILKPLEQAGHIDIPTERKKRFTYPPGTRIRFCVP